jgi:chromosome segregation ATPase
MLSVKITSKKIAITDINKAYETSSSDKYILNAAINLLKSERDHYTIKIRSSKAKGIDLKKEIDRVRSDIADNESLSRTTKNDFVCRRNLIELKQQMESLSSNYREIEIDLQLLESRKVINDAEIRSQESKLSLLVQRIDFIMANLRVETSELNSYHLQNQNLNSSIIGIRKELASRQELLRSEQSTLNGIELNIAKLPREDCLTRSSNFRKTF